MVHNKVDCLMLKGGAVSALALVTLRITNGCEGMVGAPIARIQALQFQSREARVSSDAITGMLSFDFLHALLSVHVCFGIICWYM